MKQNQLLELAKVIKDKVLEMTCKDKGAVSGVASATIADINPTLSIPAD